MMLALPSLGVPRGGQHTIHPHQVGLLAQDLRNDSTSNTTVALSALDVPGGTPKHWWQWDRAKNKSVEVGFHEVEAFCEGAKTKHGCNCCAPTCFNPVLIMPITNPSSEVEIGSVRRLP